MLAEIVYDPLVRIHIGPLAISPHGIGTAAGFLVGAQLFLPATRRRGMPDDLVFSLLTRALLGAIVGARFFYVVNNFSDFESPVEWLRIWEGGISLLGGIAGAIVVSLPLLRRSGWRFFQTMDAAIPGLAVGILIGRIGDLVIADHLGGTTTSPLGFRCPEFPEVGENVGSPCPPGELVHLTALYDLMSVSVVLGLVLLVRRRVRLEGQTTLIAAIAYGTGRFLFDFAREDVRRLGLTGSQWVAAAVVLVSVVVLLRRRHAPPNADHPDVAPGSPGADADTSMAVTEP